MLDNEIWVITCYFNPSGYDTKRRNYELFRAGLGRVGASCLLIECVFGEADFELPQDQWTHRRRGRDIMWLKERLLNVALTLLPPACTKVVWLDCDLLFEDPAWLERTSVALDHSVIVQPFDTAIRLPRGVQVYEGDGEVYESFASVYSRAPEHAVFSDFARHGHTGFAWAAQRDWLTMCGLFDCCLTGSGDHLMAHGLSGTLRSPCLDHLLGAAGPFRECFEEWGRTAAALAQGRLGCVPGRVLHLWHGSVEDRRYYLRNRQFQTFGFDPRTDVRIGADGLWRWSSHRPHLHRWARDLFYLRNEDGTARFTSSGTGH